MIKPYAALSFVLLAPPALAQTPNNDPSSVQSGSYVVEPNHTQVTFTVLHMGFSSYSGRLSEASGTLDLNAKDPTKSVLAVSVPVGTISTTSAKLDGELKSADWLNATAFPAITFKSTKIVAAKGHAMVTGELTLHGVTRPVTLAASFVGSGVNPLDKKYTVGFDIAGDIKRSDFDVKTYIPLIADKVHLTVAGVFEQK